MPIGYDASCSLSERETGNRGGPEQQRRQTETGVATHSGDRRNVLVAASGGWGGGTHAVARQDHELILWSNALPHDVCLRRDDLRGRISRAGWD
jgi:hypothetical protein